MEPIRVLLVAMPRMLSDIIATAIAAEADMTIAGHLDPRSSLDDVLDESHADLLIAQTGTVDSTELERLVQRRPGLKVLAVVAEGRQGFLYELRPQKVPLGEVSPRKIVETIRAAASHSDDVLARKEL